MKRRELQKQLDSLAQQLRLADERTVALTEELLASQDESQDLKEKTERQRADNLDLTKELRVQTDAAGELRKELSFAEETVGQLWVYLVELHANLLPAFCNAIIDVRSQARIVEKSLRETQGALESRHESIAVLGRNRSVENLARKIAENETP